MVVVKRTIILLAICSLWLSQIEGMEIGKGPFSFFELASEVRFIVIDQLILESGSIEEAATNLGSFARANKESNELVIQNSSQLMTRFLSRFVFSSFFQDAMTLKSGRAPGCRRSWLPSFSSCASLIVQFRSRLLEKLFVDYFKKKPDEFLLRSITAPELHFCLTEYFNKDSQVKWEIIQKRIQDVVFNWTKIPSEQLAIILDSLTEVTAKHSFCSQCTFNRSLIENMAQEYVKRGESFVLSSKESGMLLLWCAAVHMKRSRARAQLIDRLIEREGISVNAALNDQGQTLLFLLLCNRSFFDNEVQELCDKYNPSTTMADNCGTMPLHHMVNNRPALVYQLPKHEKEMVGNLTLLDVAAQWFGAIKKRDVNLVQEFLWQDPNLIHEKDAKGWSALHWAAFKDHENVARTLLGNGAIVNAAVRNTKLTPLMIALRVGHASLIKLLLLHKASLVQKNSKGEPAYGYLSFCKNERCMQTICERLNRKQKEYLMYLGAKNNNLLLMQLLNKQGISYGVSNSQGETPLIAASRKGFPEIVQFLVDKKVDLNGVDHKKRSALWWATLKEHVKITKILAKQPHIVIRMEEIIHRQRWQALNLLIPKIKKDELSDYLIEAIKKDAPSATIERFIKRGADVNHNINSWRWVGKLDNWIAKLDFSTDKPDFTPLAAALYRALVTGSYETVQILINHGATILPAAIQWACNQNNPTLVEFLNNAATFQKEKELEKAISTFTVVEKPD